MEIEDIDFGYNNTKAMFDEVITNQSVLAAKIDALRKTFEEIQANQKLVIDEIIDEKERKTPNKQVELIVDEIASIETRYGNSLLVKGCDKDLNKYSFFVKEVNCDEGDKILVAFKYKEYSVKYKSTNLKKVTQIKVLERQSQLEE